MRRRNRRPWRIFLRRVGNSEVHAELYRPRRLRLPNGAQWKATGHRSHVARPFAGTMDDAKVQATALLLRFVPTTADYELIEVNE